ncbi:MAG TPA: hypothetical protein VKG25_23410 [Bryobacteraceae bacterium]|nr:hypothetical protein [Bryobacteraceae bacterium]
MSLQRTRCFLLSFTLAASGYATSTLTVTENPSDASFSALQSASSEISGQIGVSQVALNETQLLDTFRADSSTEPSRDSTAATETVARAWPQDEAPAVNTAPEVAPKHNTAVLRRQGLRMSMPPLK